MNKKEKEFVETVWRSYRRHGRHSLPWRRTRNPYKILVSEVMCQQTQVDRVIPKYRRFLKKFPTVKRLAAAPLSEVLREWQGLGYNRRAKLLHECAKEITENGWPNAGTCLCTCISTCQHRYKEKYKSLQKLPGVGPYTAGALMAFAYNMPAPLIETNVRTVYLHHFFKGKRGVTDAAILRIVERTMDQENPREWYAALMDYGTHLKKTLGNQNVRSRHYAKQSAFKGSDRQIRGALVRALATFPKSVTELVKEMDFEKGRMLQQLNALEREGLIMKKNQKYDLPSAL